MAKIKPSKKEKVKTENKVGAFKYEVYAKNKFASGV